MPIDYDALAKAHGATPDYDALAKASGGTSSESTLRFGMSDDEIIRHYGYDPKVISKAHLYSKGDFSGYMSDPNRKDITAKLADSPLGDMGYGIAGPANGLAQLITHGLNKVGIASDADTQYMDLMTRLVHDDYAQNIRHGHPGMAGQLISQMLIPGVGAVKGGSAVTNAARIVGGGAMAGAMQPVDVQGPGGDYWKEKGTQTAIGAAAAPVVHGVIAGTTKVGGKVIDRALAARRGTIPAEAQELFGQAAQHGVDGLTYGDVTGNPDAQTVDTTLESVPFLGAGKSRAKQQVQVKAAATKVADTLKQSVQNTPFDGLADVQQAAASGDVEARRVLDMAQGAGSDPDRIQQASLNIRNFLKGRESNANYGKVRAMADALPDNHVPAPQSIDAIGGVIKELQDLKIDTGDTKRMGAMFEKLRENLKGGNNPYGDMMRLSDMLGAQIDSYYQGPNKAIGAPGVQWLQRVKNAVEGDMQKFTKSGSAAAPGGTAGAGTAGAGTAAPGGAAGAAAAAHPMETAIDEYGDTVSQPPHGMSFEQWEKEQEGGAPASTGEHAKIQQARDWAPAKKGTIVDGLRVHSDIPNTSSIGSSLGEGYESIGVRQVPIDALGPEPAVKSDDPRILDLARKIKKNGVIKPLIVVVDHNSEFPYVLEGSHRIDALDSLNKKTIPALVVIDHETFPAAASPSAEPRTTAASPSAEPRTAAARTTDTQIEVPGDSDTSYKARYEVRERGDLQASHNGQTFEKNPDFEHANDRNYSNAANQRKVVEWSTDGQFNPKYHINNNPDAVNGPPIIDRNGNVLGGNGRKMMLDRVYGADGKGAASYRQMLQDKAAEFGLDPKQVAGMKEPVLVRVLDDAHLKSPADVQNAITDFNKVGTAALTPSEQALADARRVSPDTLSGISQRLEELGPDATLAQAIEGRHGVDVLQQLISDKVISPQEAAKYANEDSLTKAGKERVSQLLLGRFFRDADQLDNIAPAIKNKIERIAGPLAKLEAHGEFSLTPHVKEAVDLMETARRAGMSVDDYLAQGSLTARQNWSEEAQAVAHGIQHGNPTEIVKAVNKYGEHAKYASEHAAAGDGGGLFGDLPDPQTPRSAFNDAFGTKLDASPAASAPPMVAQVPQKSASFNQSFQRPTNDPADLAAIGKAHAAADDFFKQERVPFKDGTVGNAIKSDEPDTIYGKFVQAGKGDRAQKYYNLLDDKARASVRYGMVANAVEKATDASTGIFSPKKFVTAMEHVADAQGVFFQGKDKWEMDGFKNLMAHVTRAGQYAENPPTGKRLIPLALAGSAPAAVVGFFSSIGGAVAGTGTMAIMGGARLLFTTAAGRDLLLRASALKPGSAAMARIAEQMVDAKLSLTAAKVTSIERGRGFGRAPAESTAPDQAASR